MALTINNLSKTYPNGVKALKNLSFSIGNSMFGLVGPNGAGKSSLMRTIATLQDLPRAAVELDHAFRIEEHMRILRRFPLQPKAASHGRPGGTAQGRFAHVETR